MHFEQFPGGLFGGHHCNVTTNSFEFPASSSGGFSLQGVWVDVPQSQQEDSCLPRIPMVFFGGNFEAMSGAADQAQQLLMPVIRSSPELRFRVFISAYRGYPPNHGWTRQSAIVADSVDLLKHVLHMSAADKGALDGAGPQAPKVLVVGVSMGAAAASQLAAAQPKHVAGLLVGEPWSSLWYETVVVRTPISYVLAAWVWLISPKFDTVAAVTSLPSAMPFAVLSPQADKLIHPREHRWVFEASGASKKWWLQAADTGHSNVGKQARLNARQLAHWVHASWPQSVKACQLRNVKEVVPVFCWADPVWQPFPR